MLRHHLAVIVLVHVVVCTMQLSYGDEPSVGVPLDQAVLEFNAEWESARSDVDVPRLTVEEVVAAIRHEGPAMSSEAHAIASQIAKTELLPPGAKLSLARRHFSNQSMSYVWNISLDIEKTWDKPTDLVDDVEKPRVRRGTPVESLLVRKRYLASQPLRAGQELKSLEELLAQLDR
jgi:hypothetical protein